MVEGLGGARREQRDWCFVLAMGSLGVLAVVPFAYAAVRSRSAAAWRLVTLYTVVDAALCVLFVLIPVGAGDGSPGVAEPRMLVAWFAAALLTMLASSVQLGALHRRLHTGNEQAGPATAGLDLADAARFGVHRALLSVDVENSGDPRRNGAAWTTFRPVLFENLRAAFECSGIDWASCRHQDTGDGMIVVVPPEFPKARLIYPLLDRLAAGLRHHNRFASEATQIRVRVAVHAGDVRLDDYGFTGRPKVLLARLLDASPLRQALAAAPETATVAVIVSDTFFDDVICDGHEGIDAEVYKPVTVRTKETQVQGWLHVPGHAPLTQAVQQPKRHLTLVAPLAGESLPAR
jgi:hypothetical protein